jgi:hypothetical protein
MPNREQFPTVFARLTPILRPYAPPLRVLEDGAAGFTVHAAPSPKYPDGFFVGGVRIHKRYLTLRMGYSPTGSRFIAAGSPATPRRRCPRH